mmetsp:Transcript_39635/g.83343  ORF Transcript_39635/g.83343 Transcript_39635/m.83343 type:complete len:568 (-) Transcript_39635:175-1878(-)
MSDSEDYEYEYDESDQEAMDDGGDDEEQSFEYESDEDQPADGNLENAYYDAKSERDAEELDAARETFENVVRMEVEQNRNAAGVGDGDDEDGAREEDDAMDVESSSGVARRLTPLKYHGEWSYKAIKQLVKLHLRSLDGRQVMKDYSRMLRVASSPDAAISPNALEKGVNGMLDRVSNLVSNAAAASAEDENGDPRALARNVYDLTLDAFHPSTGISPNERLWFKTNLKYGQLLYEMNETAKLQMVIRDLLLSSGQPTDILEGNISSSASNMDGTNNTTGGTHVMEIAALQIQLYSRLKDTKKLRAAYHRAMSVRGGIPHPRTLALIQELGGKMHMSQRNFNDASQAFFQAFKSYDEAGDRSRLRCLKYLVMASMLHASSINPFDSHEARAHRDDPEIVAMTNLVHAFHNDDIRKFERILKKNEGRLMDDEFVREHVADLLRTIRTQVIVRNIGPYTRIRLSRIARDLNDIPVEDVESLLVSLILDGKLEGHIDQVNGILVKKAQDAGAEKEGNGANAANPADGDGSVESRNIASLDQLTAALEHLTGVISKVGGKGASSFHQQVMQ